MYTQNQYYAPCFNVQSALMQEEERNVINYAKFWTRSLNWIQSSPVVTAQKPWLLKPF
jgi:hypothetical protein